MPKRIRRERTRGWRRGDAVIVAAWLIYEASKAVHRG